MSNEQNATRPNPKVQTLRSRWSVWLAGYVKRKYHQCHAKQKRENPADRAARRTATATVWMAFFTVVLATVSGLTLLVLKKQLREMHDGGVDTHNLAAAADDQATWTKNLATATGTQSDRTQTLADRMKEQADRTKDLADQAKIQASEAKISANAAKRAADIADETLHISQRAYLILAPPVHDFAHSVISIPILNTGHMPSGLTTIIVHEITFRIDDPAAHEYPLTPDLILEKHWRKSTFHAVPVGNQYVVEALVHAANVEQINSGKMGVAVAALMTYNDGFTNSPEQTWVFCDNTGYSSDTKTTSMRPCDEPDGLLKLMTALDEYPDPKYEDKPPN